MKKLLLLISLSAAFVGATSFNSGFFEAHNNIGFAYECESEDTDEVPVLGRPAYTPADEYYASEQYVSMNHIGDIETVWNYYQGEGLTVAVIDSGIDYLHPDFYDENGNSRIRINEGRWYAHITNNAGSGVYTTTNSTGTLVYFPVDGKTRTIDNVKYTDKEIMKHSLVSPYSSHGTNVAGTAAAFNHDTLHTGTIGIAPKAKILPIKVDFYTDSIGEALKYIYSLNNDSDPSNDVHVVNMSIEAPSTYSTITTYASYLVNKGTILVAAAGNSTSYAPSYPAANPNIIGVGALAENSSTTIAPYSNYNNPSSTSSTSTNNTEVVAPGHVYVPNYNGSHTYCLTYGTSFASPIVAGAALLWREANPTGTVSEFKSALHDSCVDIGTSGWDNIFGYGRLNIGGLLNVGSPTSIVINNPEVVDGEITLEKGSTFDLDWTVNGIGSFDTSVTISTLYEQDDVLTVDSNGRITAVGTGEEYVIITSNADSSISADVFVTVVDTTSTVTEVIVSQSVLNLDLNGVKTSTLSATVNGTNNPPQTVTWSAINDSIASVSESGVVTAKSVGTTTIRATSTLDTTKYGECTVNVSTHRVVIEKTYAVGAITWSSVNATITGTNVLSTTNVSYCSYESNSLRLSSNSGVGRFRITTSTGKIESIQVTCKAYQSGNTGTLYVGDKSLNVNYTSYRQSDLIVFSSPGSSIDLYTANKNIKINLQQLIVNVCLSDEDVGTSEDCLGLETFITSKMHMDYTENLGYCSDSTHHYYTTAKDAFNQLNDHQRTLFTTNSAYLVEWTRLSTWASINGDSLNIDNKLSKSAFGLSSRNIEENNSTLIVIAIGVTSVLSLSVLLNLKKRKRSI